MLQGKEAHALQLASEDLVQIKKREREKERKREKKKKGEKKVHPIAERKAVIRINTPLIECY